MRTNHDRPDTQSLISRLADEAGPVRRLLPPYLRAFLWLLLAGAAVTGAVVMHGLRPDVADAFARADIRLSWAASIVTGILATIAAFHLALPDRSDRWVFLPLPAAVLWMSTLGLGCYADWLAFGPQGLRLGTSFACLAFITVMSLVLGLPLVVLLRHAGPVRPVLTALAGALAVASLSSAGLELFHHLDTRLMVLVWHMTGVALVILGATSFARVAASFQR